MIGASFGVANILQDGYEFEVATFRKDIGSLDGRHPEKVEFTTMEDDAKRRDLGIRTKLIGLENQRTFLQQEYGNNPNIEIRYLKHAVPTGVIIYDDKVATLLWHDIPTAFVINSRQNADMYRKFFYDMWKIAKR